MASDLIRKRIKFAGDVHKELLKAGWDLETATGFVNNIPDADAVEVVHGEWESYPSNLYKRCSVCKREYDKLRNNFVGNYCPSCGAKMDGGDKE